MPNSPDIDWENSAQNLEKKLRQCEAELESLRIEKKIRENLTQGVVLIRKVDDIIIYTDSIFDTLFGYPHGELIGNHISMLNAPGARSPVEISNIINRELEQKGGWLGTVENIRRDGSRFWSRVAVSSFMHQEHGKIWISVHEDISWYVKMENDLLLYQTKLEELVSDKTAELSLINQNLKAEIETRSQTEKELITSQQQIKMALEGTEQGIWIWDAMSDLMLPDQNWFKILGYDFNEIDYGFNWWLEHLHPESKQKFEEALTNYLSEKSNYFELEYQLQAKAGNWLWFWTRGIATEYDPDNIPLKMIGTHRHITELKLTEAKLRENDQQIKKTNSLLTSLIESPSDINIYALDRSLCYTAFNRTHAVEMKLKVGAEVAIGCCQLDFIPDGESKSRIEQNYKKVLSGRRMSKIEEYDDSGKTQWYQSSYNPIYADNGQVIGLTVFVSDISERMSTQEELRRQEQTFRALAENSPDIIIRLNTDLEFVWVNPALEKITGRSHKEFVGKKGSELEDLGFDSLTVLERHAEEVLVGGISQTIEIHSQLDGKDVWYQARIVPESDINHQVEFILCLLRDITEIKNSERDLQSAHNDLEQRVSERTNQLTITNLHLKQEIIYRKQMEDKLLFAKRQAEVANNAKTEFLANISHELRTPMHHILNYSKFGIDKIKKPRAKLQHYFSQIRKTSQRLMFLLNELLDLSKLEAGRMEYQMQEHDLAFIAGECISELSSLIEEKKVVLKTKPFIDSPVAVCDGYKIGQVFHNLLSNAIKFTPTGKSIELSFGPGILYVNHNSFQALKISVADQGIGIPANEINHIFEKFVQSSKTKTGSGGTGLGLAISRRIIEDHNGRIWATQNPSGGATFSFLIPVQQNTPAAAVSDPTFPLH